MDKHINNDLVVMHSQIKKEVLFLEYSGSNWNLEKSVVFLGEGKTVVPGEKSLEGRARTNNKFNPHTSGLEPKPDEWRART